MMGPQGMIMHQGYPHGVTPGSTPYSALTVDNGTPTGTAPAVATGRALFAGSQATNTSTGTEHCPNKRSRKEKKKAARAKKIERPLMIFKNVINVAVANGRQAGLKTDELDEAYEIVSRADEKIGKASSRDSDSTSDDE